MKTTHVLQHPHSALHRDHLSPRSLPSKFTAHARQTILPDIFDMPRLYSIFIFLLSQTKPITQAPFPPPDYKYRDGRNERRGAVLRHGARCKSCGSSKPGVVRADDGLGESGYNCKQKDVERSLRTPCRYTSIRGQIPPTCSAWERTLNLTSSPS